MFVIVACLRALTLRVKEGFIRKRDYMFNCMNKHLKRCCKVRLTCARNNCRQDHHPLQQNINIAMAQRVRTLRDTLTLRLLSEGVQTVAPSDPLLDPGFTAQVSDP